VSTLLQTIASAFVNVRFKEPYASASLNKKFAVVNAPGAYRGYDLAAGAPALSVDLVEDSLGGDHVAVAQTSDGFSISVRDGTSGTINLDLSAFTTQTVVVAIFADYTVGTDTVVEVRGFELSEYEGLSAAVRDELVVLGTVVVPASGVIPAANVTSDRRDFPWENRALGAVPWNPVLKNSGFEMGDPSGTYKHAQPYWEVDSTLKMNVRRTDVESNSGQSALEFVTTSSTPNQNATVLQRVGVPVIPGQRIRIQMAKKVVVAPSSVTSSSVAVFFFTKAGVLSGGSPSLTIDITSVDTQFELIESIVDVPTDAAYLSSVIVVIDADWTSTGAVVRVDDFQVWLEAETKEWLTADSPYGREIGTSNIMLADSGVIGPDAAFAGNPAKISYDGSDVVIERRDQAGSGKPGLNVAGGVSGGGPGTFSAISSTSVTSTGVISTTDRMVMGSGLGGSLPDAEIPRISAAVSTFGGVEYTLVWESIPSGEKGYRKYISPTGTMIETVNAVYDNAGTWSKDVNGEKATRYTVSHTGIKLETQEDGVNSWAEAAWTRVVLEMNAVSTDDEVVGLPRTPTMRINDEAGDAKFIIDHQGYVVRDHFEVYENWARPTAALYFPLPTGAGIQDGNEDTVDQVTRHVRLQADPAGGNSVRELDMPIRLLDIAPTSGIMLTMEWWAAMSDVTTNNDMDVRMGIKDDGNMFSGEHCGIEKLEGDTNYFAVIGDSSVTDLRVDTGVTPVVDVYNKFRVELYNLTDSIGASRRALYYIDGVLVANIDIDANSPAFCDSESSVSLSLRAVSTAGNYLYVGPVHLICNYVESNYTMNNA